MTGHNAVETCADCGRRIAGHEAPWLDTDEWRESRLCALCLWGPPPPVLPPAEKDAPCPAVLRCPDRTFCPLPCQEAGSREDPDHRPPGYEAPR